ncbi:hypothetical protein ACFV0R_28480 [Streptomyces sp. NPDC059578]|uniref:hypothetical protein n=1 Tax=Streptomyces sp. NPDC059578 TaxID=3346874 RepID=UPI00369B8249
MTLNKKGSRRITVDGIEYRWRIRRKPSYMQGLCWTPMTYAVEAASGSQPGTTLIVTSGQAHPSNWVGVETEPIRPAHVAASIREARDQGMVSNPGRLSFPTRPIRRIHRSTMRQGGVARRIWPGIMAW